jgi:hypothetical protein
MPPALEPDFEQADWFDQMLGRMQEPRKTLKRVLHGETRGAALANRNSY